MSVDASLQQDQNNLIWIDLEMTGLDTTNDTILEIATLITDGNLHIVAEGPVFSIYQPEEVLSDMGEWCQRQLRFRFEICSHILGDTLVPLP